MVEQTLLVKNSNHFAKLNEMRLTGKMCDVTIIANDKKFRAHKAVLVATLEYFESTFMMNSFQENKQDIITMQTVEAKDLEAIISYAYTGEILLTDSNALSLLEVSNYLNEVVIKEACINFLAKYLKAEDACRAYKFANSIDCIQLKNVSKSTILSHFEYCTQTIEYFDFDYESLKDILSSAQMSSFEKQKIVFKGVMKWIMHDGRNRRIFLDDLLDVIQIAKLNTDFLLHFFCNYIKNPDYETIVKDTMFLYRNKSYEKKQTETCKQTVMAVDLLNKKLCIQFLNFPEKKWGEFLKIKSSYQLSIENWILLNDKCYYTCSNRADEVTLQVFDSATEKTSMLASDRRLLKFAAGCAYDGCLYFCGGNNSDGLISDQVLKYDPQSRSFDVLAPMRTKRSNAAAIFYQGCLHVLGGFGDSRELLDSVERYDPDTKKWTAFPSMCERGRLYPGVAILDAKLYVLGGVKKNSVEVYDPSKNNWQLVARMKNERERFLLVVYEDKLFAIGGDNCPTVEVYNPDQNEWQMESKLTSGLQLRHPGGGLFSSSYAK